jgi:exopolysaccharide biosynthesis polyprenyl glycosylphosphotransferase
MVSRRNGVSYDIGLNGWGHERLHEADGRYRRPLLRLLFSASAVAVLVTFVLLADPDVRNGSGIGWVLAATCLALACVKVGVRTSGAELQPLGVWVGAARGALIGFVVASAFELWVGSFPLTPAALIGITGAVFALVILSEWLVDHFAAVPRRVLIVGNDDPVDELLVELRRKRSKFRVIGLVGDDFDGSSERFRFLGSVDDLSDAIDRERPDIIVVALAARRPTAFSHLLMKAEAGFTVLEISEFFEHAFGRVPVRNLHRAWFIAVLHLYQRKYSQAAKRAFDVAVATILGLFALPIFPILVCLVRMSRGPVIVRQQRLGEHGRRFTMYKLRTMRFDAEAPGEAVWSTHGDLRVTAVGKVMRTWRLDELPQLWNVLRGDMSIVGPRPERPEFLAQLEESVPYWNRRHLVKPGITGWAQVRRGYTSDAEGHAQKLSYDLWYLRHRSLLVDFAILLETFAVLVKGGIPKPTTVSADVITRHSAKDDAGLPSGPPRTPLPPREVSESASERPAR